MTMPVRPLIYLLLICLSTAGSANQKTVSDAAQQLTLALTQVKKAPDDRNVQERYLEALYSLAGSHALEVGGLLVQLSKDAHYGGDAPSYLQNATATFGSQHIEIFLALLKQLPAGKQAHLITFLADVENHQAYQEYQLIIDHLKALSEQTVARKFEAARSKRSRQPHD